MGECRQTPRTSRRGGRSRPNTALVFLLMASAFGIYKLVVLRTSIYHAIGDEFRKDSHALVLAFGDGRGIGGRLNPARRGPRPLVGSTARERHSTSSGSQVGPTSHELGPSTEAELLQRYNLTITQELVQGMAQEGVFMVAIADNHFAEFALNWAAHVKAANITGYAVAAMDRSITVTLVQHRINTFSLQTGPPGPKRSWGTPAFAQAQQAKVRIISRFLNLGVQVLVSDLDVAWLRNPIPFLARYPEADLLISTDWPLTTVNGEERLEKWDSRNVAHLNVGIMLFRARALPFQVKWSSLIEADDKYWEQDALNHLINAGRQHPQGLPYFVVCNGTLKVGVLPVPYFAGGHAYFTQRFHERYRTQPYAVHTTFTFWGEAGKRHRLREEWMWRDDDEYYRPIGGLLAYDPHIPAHLLKQAAPWQCKTDPQKPPPSALRPNDTFGHFALVNHQLKQLRNALAIATILNRTLVLPQLWCGLDNYWNPHVGCMSPSEFELPFKCPADHILNLEALGTKFDESEYGPHIDFRERSFLAHPRLNPAVLASVVYVTPCGGGIPQSASCADGRGPATVTNNHIFIKEHMDSDKIAMALSSVSSLPLIKFSSMDGAFGNFSRPEQYTKFFRRMQHYGSYWGRVASQEGQPGSVRYDFWWDIPHTDVLGRQYQGWEVRLV